MTDLPMTGLEGVIQTERQSRAFIAEKGSLPEIEGAGSELASVIQQTRGEIMDARFATRFNRPAGEVLRLMMQQPNTFAPTTVLAIEQEGEAGLKRQQLLANLASVEGDLTAIIQRLVEIRCDLAVAQEEM